MTHSARGAREERYLNLFEANWAVLNDAIRAAKEADRQDFLAQCLRLESEVPADWRAGAFVALVLRATLHDAVGTEPSRDGIQAVAETVAEAVAALTSASVVTTCNAMLTAAGLANATERITGGAMVVYGAAATGVLLRASSQPSINDLREIVRAFYEENRSTLENMDA